MTTVDVTTEGIDLTGNLPNIDVKSTGPGNFSFKANLHALEVEVSKSTNPNGSEKSTIGVKGTKGLTTVGVSHSTETQTTSTSTSTETTTTGSAEFGGGGFNIGLEVGFSDKSEENDETSTETSTLTATISVAVPGAKINVATSKGIQTTTNKSTGEQNQSFMSDGKPVPKGLSSPRGQSSSSIPGDDAGDGNLASHPVGHETNSLDTHAADNPMAGTSNSSGDTENEEENSEDDNPNNVDGAEEIDGVGSGDPGNNFSDSDNVDGADEIDAVGQGDPGNNHSDSDNVDGADEIDGVGNGDPGNNFSDSDNIDGADEIDAEGQGDPGNNHSDSDNVDGADEIDGEGNGDPGNNHSDSDNVDGADEIDATPAGTIDPVDGPALIGGAGDDGLDGNNGAGDAGAKPIVLDLDGDGVELVDVEDSSAYFDINGDGYRNKMGWVAADDGFLSYDKDQDGKIAESDELSFVGYVDGATTDLEGLVFFDTNNDGTLSAADAEWNKFGVWQDVNQNGSSDDGEFVSLDVLGISEISLISDEEQEVSDGNTIHGKGLYTKTDGTELEFADAELKVDPAGYKENADGSLSLGIGSYELIRALNSDNINDIDLGSENLKGVIGSDSADSINAGTSKNVFITAGLGNDTIIGGAGDDYLAGDEGTDFIEGGDGHDTIIFDAADLSVGGSVNGGGGYDVAFVSGQDAVSMDLGAHGIEHITGNSGNDTFYTSLLNGVYVNALEGDDWIAGGEGADILIGGDGKDTLNGGDGNDNLIIDAEDNAADINAGGGFDYVIVGSDAGVSFEASQANAEVVVGNVGNDILSNSGSIRVGLYGGDGDDQITSGVAGDYLSGGSGADTIEGGDGIDELSYRLSTGGVDVDFEIQSIAQDSYAHFALKFGNTSSSVSFNSEKTIATHDGPALTTVYAQVEENTDDWNASTLRISNGDSTESFAFISEQLIDLNAELSPIGLSNVVTVDTSSGGSGVTVYDSSGDAIGSYNFLGDLSDGADLSFAYKKSNGQLRFYVDGKLRGEAQWTSGLEVVAGHHGANGQTVEFTYDQSYSIRQDLGLFGSEDSFGDVITNVENVAGSDHSDDIRTDAADNLLEGEAGNDILEGRGGADTLDGGSGFDWVSYNSSNAAVEIDLDAGFAVGGDATGDVLYNVEAVEGSSFSDTLTGDSNNNVLDGREGGDILKGGAGIDAVSYLASEAAVEINLKTNFHAGGDAEGDDISEIENAYGSEFADSLTGDDGDNFLRGHTGDDVLRAGAGDDKYYFALGDGQDEIYDFDERIETVETQVETQVWVDTGESSGHWSTEYSTSYSQQTVEYDAGTDILQLAPGITSDDLVFELAGAKRNIERSNTLNLVSIIVGFCSLAMIL